MKLGGVMAAARWRVQRVQHLPVRARQHLAGVRHRTPVGTATVALTFDDGPDPVHTPRLLDVLADLDVRATFFCVGARVRQHPDLVRRMVAEGHRVGSHSESHRHSSTLSLQELEAEFRAGRASLEAVLGQGCTLFRPPSGYLDTRVAWALRRLALDPWLWTVDPEDWRPGARSAEIAAVGATAGAGDVVLLHDGIELPESPEALDRSATVEAVPTIVAAVRAKGLELAPLPA